MPLSSDIRLHFAPMQGVADGIYRRLHAEIYGGIDCYYTPFIRVEKGEPRRQDMARLNDDGGAAVAQIIFGSETEFLTLTEALKAVGRKRIDLNLGCSYPMQTGRGRGAAMIADPATMARVIEHIKTDASVRYSLKMRLGFTDPAQWRALMPMLNDVELRHIAVHPRVAAQMFRGELNLTEFKALLSESRNPVVFNGEVKTPADIERVLADFGQLSGIMIGRGLLARPSLAAEWRQGREWSRAERLETLLDFHSRLLAHYESTLCGETQTLLKIKPFWEYLEEEIGRKPWKAIRKATSLAKLRAAVATI